MAGRVSVSMVAALTMKPRCDVSQLPLLDVPDADSSTDALPPLITHFVVAWPRYEATIRRVQRDIEALAGSEPDCAAPASSVWSRGLGELPERETMVAAILERVTDCARETFCGGRSDVLDELTAYRIQQACGADRGDGAPDDIAYWRALESRFGAGSGEREARCKAADKVRFRLGIFRGSASRRQYRAEPTIGHGGVTFDLSTQLLERNPADSGYCFGYRAVDDLVEFLMDMRDFARALPVNTALRYFQTNRHWTEYTVRPPLRLDLGSWKWTATKTTTRLWMPHDDALALRAALDDATDRAGR